MGNTDILVIHRSQVDELLPGYLKTVSLMAEDDDIEPIAAIIQEKIEMNMLEMSVATDNLFDEVCDDFKIKDKNELVTAMFLLLCKFEKDVAVSTKVDKVNVTVKLLAETKNTYVFLVE